MKLTLTQQLEEGESVVKRSASLEFTTNIDLEETGRKLADFLRTVGWGSTGKPKTE